MSLTSLPIELLDAVCEPLATCPSTLANLALTCTLVNPSATRILYRSISVSRHAQNLPLVHMLATRPDLAGFVHDFSITIDDTYPILRAFYCQLRVALRQMPRLSSLVLHVDAGASWILPLYDQPLSHLVHFACSFPLDVHVCAFLMQTPLLHSLQISESPRLDVQVLPDTHVPLLETYTGPAALLPSLTSRPLSTIHLTGDLRIEDVLQAMGAPGTGRLNSEPISFPYTAPKHTACEGDATARKTLRVLSAVTSAPPAELLEALALAYPDLAYLRLMTMSAFWEAPDMTLYTRISETLSSLPALSVFELAGMHWEARPKSTSPSDSRVGDQCIAKEWISPPVTPRALEVPAGFDTEDTTLSLEFSDSYFDWSY